MRTINHYPGGDPVSRRQLDVDTFIGVLSIALVCAGLLTIWRT